MKKLLTFLMTALLAFGVGWAENIYVKVENTSQLEVGKTYILVYENGNSSACMGSISGGYGSAIQNMALSNNTIDIDGKSVLELTLDGSTNAWTFHTGSGYLASTGDKSISVRSSVDEYTKWTVTSSFTLVLTQNSDRKIQYNSSSPRFTTYRTAQKAAYLYVKQSAVTSPTLTVSDTDMTLPDIPVNGSSTSGQFNVSGSNLTGDVTLTRTSGSADFSLSTSSITPSNGSVNQNVTVTYSGTSTTESSATFSISSPSATTQYVTVRAKKATSGGSDSNTFTLVTNTNNPEDGEYVLVYSSGTNYALSTWNSSGYYSATSSNFTLSSNIVTLSSGNSVNVLTLIKTGNSYYIKDANDYYVGYNSSANLARNNSFSSISNNNNYKWNISIASNGDATITNVGTNTRVIRLRENGYDRWAAYSTSNSTGYVDGRLYKRDTNNPRLTVSDNSIDLGTITGGAQLISGTFTLTGANLTAGVLLSSSNNDFTVSPGTINDANGDNTITVTYSGNSATTASTTITIESVNNEVPDVTVTVTAKRDQVATPTFSPASGTYNSAQPVTISSETQGATISYRTSTDNGTTWSSWTSGTSLTVSQTTTIEAYASLTGYVDSETATATYTIDLSPTLTATPSTLTISDSGTGNTFTVEGSNLGTDNVGLTQTDGTNFDPTLSATTGSYYDGGTYWGFTPAGGSVNGTVAMEYIGRALSASETVTLGNNTGASATVTVNYLADLYIVGNFGSGWDFSTGTPMTYNNGTYTASVTVDAGNLILFARKYDTNDLWNTRYVFGPNSSGDWWVNGDVATGTIDLYDDDPIYFSSAGTYIIEINASTGALTITKEVVNTGDFVLVTDATDLVVGNEVIIVNSATAGDTAARTMGERRTNNYYGTGVTVSATLKVTPTNDTQIFTLEQGTGGWYFKTTDDLYLNSMGSGNNNNLQTKGKDANGTGTSLAVISISSNNVATIHFQGSGSRQYLRYNANNGASTNTDIFSCYQSATTQADVFIYQRSASTEPRITVDPSTIDIVIPAGNTSEQGTATVTESNTTGTTSVSVGGEDANNFTASLNSGSLTVTYTGSATSSDPDVATVTLTNGSASATVNVTGYKLPMTVTITPGDGHTFSTSTATGLIESNVADATIEYSFDGTTWYTYNANNGFTTPEVSNIGGTVTVYARATKNGETATAQATYTRVAPSTKCTADIVFDPTSNNGGVTTWETLQTHMSEGTDYISDASMAAVYTSNDYDAFRFGSGSNVGHMTFTLKPSAFTGGAVKLTKVTINAARYSDDSGCELKVSTNVNTTGQTLSITASQTNFADYVFNFDGREITTLTIANETAGCRVYVHSISLEYDCGPAVPEVVINPSSRNVNTATVNVTMTSTPNNAVVYYTTDGSDPTTSSTQYNGAFNVNLPNVGDQVTVKAIAVCNGVTSEVATATYTRVNKIIDVNAPFFSPLEGGHPNSNFDGTYYGAQTLEIATSTENADIYYVIQEVSGTTPPASVSDPSKSSTHYTAPIPMVEGKSYRVKAIAYIGDFASTVSEGYYVIKSFDDFKDEHSGDGYTYVANCAEFNALTTTGNKVSFTNPVQVVYHSTYVNNGTSAEFCYVRDNSDYACIYFGKADTHNYHIFEMGDWIDGYNIAGKLNIWEHNYHNQLGNSQHTIEYWPTDKLGWSEIVPETTTCTDIASGTPTAGQNKWGHYVHVRYATMSDVHDESGYQPSGDYDMKHTGHIQDHTNEVLTYYDKFYLWSAGTCRYDDDPYTINAKGDYTQEFFDGKQNAGATFDVYGVVDWYGTNGVGIFQVCPIDFQWIYKPVITPGTNLNCMSEQVVEINVTTPEWDGATTPTIYYKTDDMDDWEVYDGPFIVNSDTHVQVYAQMPSKYDDMMRSEIVSTEYKFVGIKDPIITPESQVIEVITGNEQVTPDVTIQTNPESDPELNTVTLYTLNGEIPTLENGTVVENGQITLDPITETTTVTAISYIEVSDGQGGTTLIWSNPVTRTYTFVKSNGVVYDLVTSAVETGKVYVIVNKDAYMGLSTAQNGNNRGSTGVMFTDNSKDHVYGNDELALFVLESANAGRYYFKSINGGGYLTVTTNDVANLSTSATTSSYSEAGVAIGAQSAGYPATITFNYDGTNRYMRYFAKGRTFTTNSDATLNENVFLYGTTATPLAYIESEITAGPNQQVTVSDDLIGAWAVNGNGYKYLFAKDMGYSINKTFINTDLGQIDYMRDVMGWQKNDWDQSNWVIIDFSGRSEDNPEDYVGMKLTGGTIQGKYVDDENYRIVLESQITAVSGDAEAGKFKGYGYAGPINTSENPANYAWGYNTYMPGNFNNANLNLDGNQGFVAGDDAAPAHVGNHLFFMNPKIQEVARIWGVWDGNKFTVYKCDKATVNGWAVKGAFDVHWDYNRDSQYEKPSGIDDHIGEAHLFHAVIVKKSNSKAPSAAPRRAAEIDPSVPANDDYDLYPLDMSNGGNVTAVKDLTGEKVVVSVRYYNIMGMESEKPFDGVNIIVTRYSDGTTSTIKVLK